MIFRRKSNKAPLVSHPEVASYALIPMHHGKSNRIFGDQIISIIEKSSFLSTSPLVKRLIVKNVKVWCIVIEKSGSKSVKIICASVPYMMDLIARASPRFKTFLEDERVDSYLKFFQEVDFVTYLCRATLVIQNGVEKCNAIISVHMGREALVFTKNSLCYLRDVFLQSVVSAVHFLCEDMPHILQFLYSQNCAIVRYFVLNLPVIALSGAKHSLLISLFIQRLIVVSLKTANKFVSFSRQIILNSVSEIDMTLIYAFHLSVIAFISSQCALKSVKSVLIQFSNDCYPILRKYFPLAWAFVRNFIRKCFPVIKMCVKSILLSLPKILKFCDDNKSSAIWVIFLVEQCIKDLLCKIKPLLDKSFRVLQLSSKNVLQLFRLLLPYIECVVFELFYNLKCLLTSKNIRSAFLFARPIAGEFFLRGCYTLMIFYKCLLTCIKHFISSLSVRREAGKRLLEMNSLLTPVISEINSTCFDCVDEVMSCLVAQRVTPSLWSAWKTVTPVAISASREIFATTKSSTVMVYPELRKAVVVVFPELKKGLTVVLQDSSCACVEIATVSYLASQELIFAFKCVSLQLPFVFKAFGELSVVSSGAMTEIVFKSARAKIRVKKDLARAIEEVGSAINSAQFELWNIVSDTACEIDFVILDSDIHAILIFFSATNQLIFTYACKQYFSAVHDFSSAIQYSSAKMKQVSLWIMKCLQRRTSSIQLFSKNCFADMYDNLACLFVDFILLSSDCVVRYSKLMLYAFVNKMFLTLPILWGKSKSANALIWKQCCKSSSHFWILLELEMASAFQFTCLYTPELWNFLKKNSHLLWQFTCDMSPALWDLALPVLPVLWVSNCNAMQCMWEFHVNTCSSTWKVIVPMTSFSWQCVLKTCPKAWVAFCDNSKIQWNSFCNIVEFSWMAMTMTSSLSWKIFHKTVSKSWKTILKPVTASACSGAVAKSLKFSNSVCSKSKELLVMYKTLYDFSDIQLE